MAESLVQVTEGSGKKLHTFSRTIGANTVEDEVIVLGEQYLASYSLQAGGHSTATANSHVVQVMAGGTLRVRIRRIEIWQFALATTAALTQWDLVRLSTAGTGGGALAAGGLDPADAAPGAAGMSLPTVKGTEGTLIARAMPYVTQTVPTATADPSPLIVWDFDRPRMKPLIIAAGVANGIAIKNVTAIAGMTITATIWFDESNF